jgi:23S rRNA (adenine2503-C2)-methyltransferase
MDLKPPLYGRDLEEVRKLVEEIKTPAYRAGQILDWLYKKHIRSLDEAQNLPRDLRKRLSEKCSVASLSFSEDQESGNHESAKFLFRTHDGHLLESVLIFQQNRRTICVSTQLGCKIGCIFCASGKGKFGRNLTAGEIIEQVAWIEKKTGSKVSNVVFMGMGEPLDNFEATMKALKILQAPWGFGLGARRITVSTSGITPKIVEFVKRSEGRVRLSVSLHSSRQAKRTELVPINRRYTLKELIETLNQLHRNLKREITFEYTLIQDVNDSREEAEGVAKIAKPLGAKVNIIPYNPIREMDFKTPDKQRIEQFRDILQRHGVRVTVRQTAGRDIDAACGQLRLDRGKSSEI